MKKEFKFNIKIDREKCKGCKLCVVFCPKSIIKISDKLNKKGIHFVEITTSAECTGCTNCAIVCPECAIEITQTDLSATVGHP